MEQLVRTSKILTGSYVIGDEGNTSGTNQANIIDLTPRNNELALVVDFTKGSLTSGEIKVEFSYDGGVTWAREINSSVSSGTSTVSANEFTFGTSGVYQVPVPTVGATQARVSAKGTGADPTGSLMAIDAYLAYV